MNVEEVVVSQKTPNAINEETELYGFGYGSVVENILSLKVEAVVEAAVAVAVVVVAAVVVGVPQD